MVESPHSLETAVVVKNGNPPLDATYLTVSGCDQIVSTTIVSYCVIFSDIATGWGVYANDPALSSL
jgi:hypothetical protein